MKITGGDGVYTFTLPGIVRAAKRAILSFRVSGPLVELPVDEGQHVKKGDLIAQIQKRDFQTAVEEARARSREADQQYKRYKELYSKKQVSQADFDRYRSARKVARARLEDAINALHDTSLVAPFDGVIAKRYVENHQKVQEKEPIVNLQNISRIEIVTNVPETIMATVRNRGDVEAYVKFDPIPGKRFPLQLKEYSTDADPATRTYEVVFTMERPESADILPGMTAQVIVTLGRNSGEGKKPIKVPAIAVIDAPGNHPYVWVYDQSSGTVHKREIKVSAPSGSGYLEVMDGLVPGEMIVVAGVTKLREGMKVRPWDKQRENM
jgi:RND family efflux transporter MFP subunit